MTRDDYRAQCIEAIGKALFEVATEANMLRAEAAFDALHGIAPVCPVEATEEMKMHARISSNTSPENLWRVMSVAGDLTNPPEEKP